MTNDGERRSGRRALCIDLDGTLADSVPPLRQAYRQFLESQGLQGSDEEFHRLVGPPLDEVVARLKAWHDLESPHDRLMKVYGGFINGAYASVSPARGARHLLEVARATNRAVAVVTSSREVDTLDWLNQQDLADLVDTVVGAESVTKGKPDPEPYQCALRHLDCGAAVSLAVEDSPAGVASALAAGLVTYAVASPLYDSGAFPPQARPVAGLDDVAEVL